MIEEKLLKKLLKSYAIEEEKILHNRRRKSDSCETSNLVLSGMLEVMKSKKISYCSGLMFQDNARENHETAVRGTRETFSIECLNFLVGHHNLCHL